MEYDALSLYYSQVEKYLVANGLTPTRLHNADLTIIVACGTVDILFNTSKEVLGDIESAQGNLDSVIIMGFLPVTFKGSLTSIFKGEILTYGEEDRLDEIINAKVQFSTIESVHVFNVSQNERDNNKDKLFTINNCAGCLRKCTYCVIHLAHGYIRSKSIKEIKREYKVAIRARYKSKFIECGPKRSLSIIDLDAVENIEKTACRPRNNVIASATNDWCIVLCNSVESIPAEHPLSRTVYIYHVDDIAQSYKFIDSDVQTVSLHPWNLAFEHRDELAERGGKEYVSLDYILCQE